MHKSSDKTNSILVDMINPVKILSFFLLYDPICAKKKDRSMCVCMEKCLKKNKL